MISKDDQSKHTKARVDWLTRQGVFESKGAPNQHILVRVAAFASMLTRIDLHIFALRLPIFFQLNKCESIDAILQSIVAS